MTKHIIIFSAFITVLFTNTFGLADYTRYAFGVKLPNDAE